MFGMTKIQDEKYSECHIRNNEHMLTIFTQSFIDKQPEIPTAHKDRHNITIIDFKITNHAIFFLLSSIL